MSLGPLVFVDVDTQRDFLDPAGVLFIPGSEIILPNLGRLTHHARERAIPVLATACAHTQADKELEQFPPHCLVGTWGQRRVPETAWTGSRILRSDERFTGELPPHLTVEKRELDVFSRPDVDELVSRYGKERPMFVVYGVATDYCVGCAVRGLLARKQRLAIVADAVRAFEPSKEPRIFAEFLAEGALLIATDAVIGA